MDDHLKHGQETVPISNEEKETNPNEPTISTMALPFARAKGETMIKDLRNIPETQEYGIVQTGTKLFSRFNVKDKVDDKQYIELFL